jgi:molybdopterin synthase sulfur carrier subunit
MRVAIAVRVRFFARLREQAGTDLESLEVPAGSTLADVYAAVRELHPALESDRDSVRGAINQEFADWTAPVADADEVAFIPPVSGGV